MKKVLSQNLMLPWQPNKMAAGHQTQKLGRQSSNMVHVTSVVMEKMQFNHFPIISLSFCCHGNQTKSQITIILAILKSPNQRNILTKLGTNLINGFGGVVV